MEETVSNLAKAFIGESQARNRYTIYAKVAREEGYDQVGEIFELTAENEREHAKWLMRMIKIVDKERETIQLDGVEVPVVVGKSEINIRSAIVGENYECTKMYPDFVAVAKKEGFIEVANRLRSIATAEEHHEKRFRSILRQIESNSFFKKDKGVEWVCRKCGYIQNSKTPPTKCPSCDHPANYFELKCEKY